MFRSSRGGMNHWGWVLVIAMGLSACTKPDGKPDGVNRSNDSATFLVKNVSADDPQVVNRKEVYINKTDGGTRKSGWRVPRAVTYNFNACIQDRGTRKDATGQRFRVEIPGTKQSISDISATTPSGCFSWKETIPFLFYVKNSRWVVVERDIVGDGIHTGRQRVRFALNPWAVGGQRRDGEGSFVFLRESQVLAEKNPVPYDQAEEAFSGRLMGPDEMIADGVSVQAIRKGERSSGTFAHFEMTLEPKVRFAGQPDVDAPKWEKIPSGDFFVVAHLLVDSGGAGLDQRMILGSGETLKIAKHKDAQSYPGVSVGTPESGEQQFPVNGYGRVIDGKLILRMDAWIENRVAQGNLRLALKLIPRGVEGLKPFEGVYELGNIKSLASGYRGDLIEECRESDEGCKVASYLEKSKNFAEARASGLAKLASPYLFEKVKLRFVQVEPGETATARTVRYQASTCVIDWFTGDKVVDLPFKVSYKDSAEVKEVKTLPDGCISWTSSIFHNYYEPEMFIKKDVVFTKGNGVSAERSFFINPWDDKFTFGFDESDFPAELLNSKKVPSRFFLADYGYHTVRFQYNIDSLMGLEVKKTVLMELHPQVLRYSGIINARKMTEPLRDGIWLMKVAIQKNYLDPAQAGVVIDKLQENQSMIRLLHEPTSQEAAHRHKRLRDLGIEAQTKEYITTRTALVRVTDGVIIQPVELTMQDLRMMRVRANFLVQLEAVDERKLQLDNELRKQVERVFRDLNDERSKRRMEKIPEDPSESEEEIIRRDEERIEKKKQAYLAHIQGLYADINRQLNATGTHIDLVPKEAQLKCENGRATVSPDHDAGKTEEEIFEDSILRELACRFRLNDFTTLKLPTCGEDNCNRFREANSYLKPRTFVGPVIFLHNAYKDSVRATDNLDEARCDDPIIAQDQLTEDIRRKQAELLDGDIDGEIKVRSEEKKHEKKAEAAAKEYRPNTLYTFGEYFGSLRHLCFADVDRLIQREKDWRKLYEKNGPVVASPYNFAQAYNVNFLSLRDEPLFDIPITPEKLRECNYDLQSCIEQNPLQYAKFDRSIPLMEALDQINSMLGDAPNLWGPQRWFTKEHERDDVKTSTWEKEDLRSAIFAIKPKAKNAYDILSPRSARFAGCVLLMNNIVDQVQKRGGKETYGSSFKAIRAHLIRTCLRSDHVSFDRKLRVYETGRDNDPYIFLGGMNLNLNVGQSFSVSRSQGFNWSAGAGVELFDMVGPAKASRMLSKEGADFHGALMKPLSLKAGTGYGESFGSSDGTSIADSTYLVAQIAGFKVRLDKFERCAVMRLNPDFIQRLAYNGVGSFSLQAFLNQNRKIVDLSRGIMVCEGELNKEPRTVKESYFYFTQHFTEGDMLDQADLYNHPWLLALRGQRDFATFLRQIRGQEPITVGNFVSGIWKGKERTLDWPLDHMLQVYRKDSTTPSFPGYYTEIRENEEGTALPLERGMLSRYDTDPNCEVRSADRRPRGAPICDQRFAR